MSDLDTEALRQALKTPAGPELGLGGPPDVTEIMKRGRRLRYRRRVAAVAGCLCLAGILGGAGAAVVNLTSTAPAQVQPASPAGRQPSKVADLLTPTPTGKQSGQPQATASPVPSATATSGATEGSTTTPTHAPTATATATATSGAVAPTARSSANTTDPASNGGVPATATASPRASTTAEGTASVPPAITTATPSAS